MIVSSRGKALLKRRLGDRCASRRCPAWHGGDRRRHRRVADLHDVRGGRAPDCEAVLRLAAVAGPELQQPGGVVGRRRLHRTDEVALVVPDCSTRRDCAPTVSTAQVKPVNAVAIGGGLLRGQRLDRRLDRGRHVGERGGGRRRRRQRHQLEAVAVQVDLEAEPACRAAASGRTPPRCTPRWTLMLAAGTWALISVEFCRSTVTT